MTQGWYILSPLDKNTLLEYKKLTKCTHCLTILVHSSEFYIANDTSDIIHVWIVVYFTGNYRNYTIKDSEGSLETLTWSLPQVQRYGDLHVKCPLLSSNFNQERNMLTNCSITPKSQFCFLNYFSHSQAVTCGQMDREELILICTFSNF
jgi:hypothetical protein